MDSCQACTASLIRNGTLHCGDGHCAWIKCNTCGVTIDADTATYFSHNPIVWGNNEQYLKGGESVCQPQNTPKPNETNPSPSTTPTDQQP